MLKTLLEILLKIRKEFEVLDLEVHASIGPYDNLHLEFTSRIKEFRGNRIFTLRRAFTLHELSRIENEQLIFDYLKKSWERGLSDHSS